MDKKENQQQPQQQPKKLDKKMETLRKKQLEIANTFKDEVLKKYKDYTKSVILFGSLVRGDFHEKSDIDLLVEFEGRKSLLDLVGLKLELEELLEREVDILTYRSLHPLLKERILDEQEVIL